MFFISVRSDRFAYREKLNWSQRGFLDLDQVKSVNCNQIQGHVAGQNCVAKCQMICGHNLFWIVLNSNMPSCIFNEASVQFIFWKL